MTTKILTRSNVLFDLAAPRPSMVRRQDILYALSNIPRFTGHADEWSVLNHSVLVASLVQREHNDPRLTLVALYHDAHEAYTGDISTPMKNVLGRERVAEIEEGIQRAIHTALGIPDISWEAYLDYIKPADEEALSAEYDAFFEYNYASRKSPGNLQELLLPFGAHTVAWHSIESTCRKALGLTPSEDLR